MAKKQQVLPRPHVSGYFLLRRFLPPFSNKYATTRSIFESQSPVHTKTLKRWKYHSFIIEHALCQKYMMYDIIVFRIRNRFRPSTRKRKADVFKNLDSRERFCKGAFSVINFSALVSVEGRLNRRKNVRFQTKTDTREWGLR